MTKFVWKFRDYCFQSEMLPEIEDLGFDYAADPRDAESLHIDVENDLVSIFLTSLCDAGYLQQHLV